MLQITDPLHKYNEPESLLTQRNKTPSKRTSVPSPKSQMQQDDAIQNLSVDKKQQSITKRLLVQQSNFSTDENQTVVSTIDFANQKQLASQFINQQERSSSQQPTTAMLPTLTPQKSQLPSIPIAKFQSMVYNRNYVLNIDNQTTNRNNQHYISGYYKKLSDQSIIPAQQALTYKSLRSLDYKSPMRSSSVIQQDRQLNNSTEIKQNLLQMKMIHEQSLMTDLNIHQQSQRLQPTEMQKTISYDTKLPSLVDQAIISNLNQGIQLSARIKAAQLISENERRKHRKDITKQLIGMADYESHAGSERPFKPKGTLELQHENVSDQLSNSQKSESIIESSIFNVLQDNYSDYVKELEEQNATMQRQTLKVRAKLIPAERLRFDADEEFARSTILTAHSNKEDGEIDSDDEPKEPERNFDKLRARIKLKSIKKFEEDEKRKNQLLQKAALVAASGGERLTSAQRKRKKHEPIKRRRSFTECQLKFEDGLELYSAEKAANQNHSLTDKNTITKMEKAQRFPIPESLLNRPLHYWLKIDSLIHNIYDLGNLITSANVPPDLKAPKNSDVSADNLSIGSDSSENEVQGKKNFLVTSDSKIPKQFDKTLVDLQPFRIENVMVFPHKARDGDMPIRLLNTPKIDYLTIVSKTIADQQKEEKGQYSVETIQQIFEYYCTLFKVQSIDITQYVMSTDNQRTKFSIKNFVLSENISKAIACTIPFIYGIYEIELMNNQITDIISSLYLISSFINPSIRRFSYVGNFGRSTFKKTFQDLIKENPDKFQEINLTRSVTQIEILENMTRSFSQNLIKMNLSGCGLSINGCRVLNIFLLKQQFLKDLNLMRCKLANQSARYIIDALNRNCTIRHLNLSYNDLSSSIYEFSIKFASMLTRHPTLLHADISQNGFKREETMFIILAMSTSKNFLSMHISGNELPYYERIFMRSLIAARVHFNFKNESNRQEIKLNKERYQVMQLASKEHLLPELKNYLETFDKLEEQRQGLDFEIEDLIKEINMEKHYAKVKNVMKLEEIKPGSKLGILISKITERTKELGEQQDQVKEMMKLTVPQIKERLDTISGRADSMLNTQRKLEVASQAGSNQALQVAFQAQVDMKQERQRQRAEQEAIKAKKERSAGEMALLFMGINQVAYDLLIENPMTGYMNEIIYTRILGHDDIEQGNYWCDTTQCYICQKWEKQVITYDPRTDTSKWSQRITQINHLKNTIESLVHQAEEAELVQNAQREAERVAQVKFENERKKVLENSDDESPSRATGAGRLQRTSAFKGSFNNRAKGISIKINLKPDQSENLNQTATALKNLGPDILSPRFGGVNGLTPMGNSLRKASGVDEGYLTKRSRAESQVDKGQFSSALDKTPIGQELQLDRHDTPLEKVNRPNKQDFNSENPIQPCNLKIKNVQSHIFPEQFVNANDFLELNLGSSELGTPEEGQRPVGHISHDKYMLAKQTTRYGGPPGGIPGLSNLNLKKASTTAKSPSLRDLTKTVINQNENNYQRATSPHASVAPSMVTSIQNVGGKRLRGQPQKIQRTLFFHGMVYVIEEEVYSDSDNSSVYTSEDDFEEDKGMIRHYIAQTDDYNARMAYLAEERRLAALNPKKTEKELRLEKLGIVDETKRELTQAQKEYKTKIWPKHYIPSLKEYKSQQLDLVGKDLELKIGGQKEGKRTIEDRGPAISSGPLDNHQLIYIVASFNDWMPVKLKTKRELTFEKLNPDEPIPKATFVLDNLIQLHANYMPPGKHFFYFVKQEGTILLSPQYDVVRFKTTNIFLNQIVIKPRIFDFDAVNIVKGGDDEEAVFMKDRSVFRDFKDDTKPYLRKCFDQDIQYTKIHRTVKGEEEVLDDIKELLFKHFVKINNIFLYYIGISTYPTISMNDFTSWANKCNLVDGKWINLATLDRILITTNVALHGLISSAERDLNRYEFLEIIVRIANALYRESKVCETTPQAIQKLLIENIFPNSKEVNGEHFRRFQCYNVKVNEILKKNESVLKKIYDSYTHSKKKFITLPECREYIRKVGLDVSEMQVGVIFAESMCTIIDTIIDQERPNQMKYVEFLVFLCRIAYEHYRGSHYENEMMYLKLEKLIPKFLNVLNLQPIFLFYEEFEYKPMVKKAKKVKIVKKKESSDDSSDSKPESEEEESSSEDDLGECIILEEGKYKLSLNFIQKMEREKIEKAERRRVRAENAAKKAEERAAQEADKKQQKKKGARADY